jgi:cardiolipin synthase
MKDNGGQLDAELSNRIWTVPNILSFIRLLGIPLFLWLVLVEQADVWAFVVLVLASASDWLDGALARALNQTSKLGALLDPLADRLYIAATIIGLALRGIIPWWLVLTLALRDVMLVLLLPALRRRGLFALPVTLLGKAATFCLLWGFPALLLGSVGGAIGTFGLICGWAFSLWCTALYWWAGLDYVRRGLRLPLVK